MLLGFLLGNGWYSQDQNIPPSMPQPTYGPPRVILQLNIQSGDGSNTSIVTDGTWTGRSGSILRDSIYQGERVDGRLIRNDWAKPNFNDPNSLWIPVDNMPSPGGVLSSQMMESVRANIYNVLNPVRLFSPALNTWVFDLGQNFAGWVRLKLKGPSGLTVRLRYAEILEHPASNSIYTGMIYIDNLRAADSTDEYSEWRS